MCTAWLQIIFMEKLGKFIAKLLISYNNLISNSVCVMRITQCTVSPPVLRVTAYTANVITYMRVMCNLFIAIKTCHY